MNIVKEAEHHVRKLLTDNLPVNRVFHDVWHTLSVVNGAEELCCNTNVSDDEKELVLLAAWFHDVGHIKTFFQHEMVSQQIAGAFLKKHNYPLSKIELILQLIGATQMPVSPSNLLEEIICDADLYHLSTPDYYIIQKKLRMELRLVMGKDYQDEEWQKINIHFLENHYYFTKYGRNVLAKCKEININICKSASNR